MRTLSTLILASLALTTMAQNNSSELPFREIPPAPETYNATTVAARMIDGLGFRFYWASEGLRAEDLDFKPSPDARTTMETIDHIYGLTTTILNAAKKQVNEPVDRTDWSYEQLRSGVLTMLEEASNIMRSADPAEMEEMQVIFKGEPTNREYPYWNMINGPLADAIYHTGQLVSFRRASGNPKNPNVSVFTGTVRE